MIPLQQQVSQERAQSEECMMGMVKRIVQRQDAQMAAMQQSVQAIFGILSQLLTQPNTTLSGLPGAPQATLQGNPPVVPAAVSSMPFSGVSLSTLFGSAVIF